MKIILVMAMSADGFITMHDDGLVNWTSKADKEHFTKTTQASGVVIYGRKTYDTFKRALPGRLNIVMTSKPEQYQSIPEQLEFTNQPPRMIVKNLESRGFTEIALTGGSEINSMFLSDGLIDELYLTISPKLFGSGKRLLKDMHLNSDLQLLASTALDQDTILLHYKIVK